MFETLYLLDNRIVKLENYSYICYSYYDDGKEIRWNGNKVQLAPSWCYLFKYTNGGIQPFDLFDLGGFYCTLFPLIRCKKTTIFVYSSFIFKNKNTIKLNFCSNTIIYSSIRHTVKFNDTFDFMFDNLWKRLNLQYNTVYSFNESRVQCFKPIIDYYKLFNFDSLIIDDFIMRV